MNQQKDTIKLKNICLTGLSLFVLSYWIFTQGNDFAYSQKPIDFAHWLNLTGAILLLNFNNIFPKNNLGKMGSILTSLGVIAFIGLNTIDFISWSFGEDYQGRIEFYNRLARTPAITFPFIFVGPSLLFLGLSIHTINYLKSNLIGFILTLFGAIFMGLSYFIFSDLVFTALGVTIFSIGLTLILNKIKVE